MREPMATGISSMTIHKSQNAIDTPPSSSEQNNSNEISQSPQVISVEDQGTNEKEERQLEKVEVHSPLMKQ
jgi:hypothetical protein